MALGLATIGCSPDVDPPTSPLVLQLYDATKTSFHEALLAFSMRNALDDDLREQSITALARNTIDRARTQVFECRPGAGLPGMPVSMQGPDAIRVEFRNCATRALSRINGTLVFAFARNADGSVRLTITAPPGASSDELRLTVGSSQYYRFESVIDLSRGPEGFVATSVRTSVLVQGSRGQWIERTAMTPGSARATLNVLSGCFTVAGASWSAQIGATRTSLAPRCVVVDGFRQCQNGCPNFRTNSMALHDGSCPMRGAPLVSLDYLGAATARWRAGDLQGTITLGCGD